MFDALGWQSLIDGCEPKEWGTYQELFRDKASELDDARQPETARAARALQCLAEFDLFALIAEQAFLGTPPKPDFQFRRPRDFDEPLLAIFATMARSATDPEFKAKLADLCWSTQEKRDSTMVTLAVEGYIDSAENLQQPVAGESEIDRDHRWGDALQRLHRALKLVKMTSHPLTSKVQAAFERVFKDSLAEVPLFQLGLLLTYYQADLDGDTHWLIRIADSAAARVRTEKQWPHLNILLSLKAKWLKKAGFCDVAIITQEERAENYLRDVDGCRDFEAKARCVAKAIKAYQNVSPKSPRIQVLEQLFREYQRQAMAERRGLN